MLKQLLLSKRQAGSVSPTYAVLQHVMAPLYFFVLGQFSTLSSSPILCFQGQCFVAINPENFAPGFNDRMSDLLSIHRGMEPVSRGHCYDVKTINSWENVWMMINDCNPFVV